jgi:formate/nitrite transporter FocA (FNT family)
LGVGAALAIGGGLFGTLIPQIAATIPINFNPAYYQSMEIEAASVELFNNLIIVLGTLGTFFYFTFAVRAPGLLGGFREIFVRFLAGMGRLMIIFTLGALFANTVSSRVALLISRIQFLASFFGG